MLPLRAHAFNLPAANVAFGGRNSEVKRAMSVLPTGNQRVWVAISEKKARTFKLRASKSEKKARSFEKKGRHFEKKARESDENCSTL
jgi:hypothetical protein